MKRYSYRHKITIFEESLLWYMIIKVWKSVFIFFLIIGLFVICFLVFIYFFTCKFTCILLFILTKSVHNTIRNTIVISVCEIFFVLSSLCVTLEVVMMLL